jgi:hypothetical protein
VESGDVWFCVRLCAEEGSSLLSRASTPGLFSPRFLHTTRDLCRRAEHDTQQQQQQHTFGLAGCLDHTAKDAARGVGRAQGEPAKLQPAQTLYALGRAAGPSLHHTGLLMNHCAHPFNGPLNSQPPRCPCPSPPHTGRRSSLGVISAGRGGAPERWTCFDVASAKEANCLWDWSHTQGKHAEEEGRRKGKRHRGKEMWRRSGWVCLSCLGETQGIVCHPVCACLRPALLVLGTGGAGTPGVYVWCVLPRSAPMLP